ncbi:MAG TPA: radical SAM protein [Acidimicrobiales bacterium]|nr:radical SAM protein [Acidimicrobiales bacterium]
MSPPPDLRWRLADDDPQGTLFDEVERHVGGGEFRGMEFLHVRARRIINEVPKTSAVPFRYTINAYRGCSHACVYCTSGDTAVLLAEGRLRPIADLRVGDLVIGTERVGRYRRYVATPVLAHWSTIKPAFRVTLEDGAKFVASGDHRFLTERGWKHVSGTGGGADCRPHLTPNNSLLGIGPMPRAPIASPAYQRGYLCGMVRGDAAPAHRIIDLEPLTRTRAYLQTASVPTTEFLFAAATGSRQAIRAIRTQARAAVERIESLVEWPSEPSEDWTKGFLAGIYDAEGHFGEVIRISNKDPEILAQISSALARLRFRSVCERPRANGVCPIRLLGGLPEIVRFILTVDPATTRKRTITGRAMKGTGARQVVSVEPLGLEMPMYDITTGTGDFIANGVVSHNCFARPTHEYLGMDAGEDFERRIVVKVNAVERLRAELAPGQWAGDHIAMGTNTDPYQRCEGKYRLTRGIVGVLAEAANPFSILTKSTLVLSDLELLAEAARRTDVAVNLSIGTLDEEVWRATEPGTPHPLKRVEAVARLNAAGVASGVLVAPVLPGLSDQPEQLEAVVKACVEAGARSISPILLHLRPGVREQYLGWLAGARPDLLDEHTRLYPRAYAPKATQNELSRLVAAMVARHGGRSASPGEARSVEPPRTPRPRPSRQLPLGI